MRESERVGERRRLDKELRLFQVAGKQKFGAPEYLRRVRRAVGYSARDLARKLKVNPSVLFRLEESEMRGTITMKALRRVAEAMRCQVVYAIVPFEGTIEELAEWEALLKRTAGRRAKEEPREPSAADGNRGIETMANAARRLLAQLREAGIEIGVPR
jgi:predicted DNA-binding mobile mystery protein A